MKLKQLVTQYVTHRKSLGQEFKTDERNLKYFCKTVGSSKNIRSISEDMTNAFLYGGSNVITEWWFRKYTTLHGFYQYALTRNYITAIPLPHALPKRPPPFVPYIYSKKELKLIFDTALAYRKERSVVSPRTAHVMLVLTYALGLRPNETLSITLGDIDMDNLTITIQKSKNYKSRLVPFSQQINGVIKNYLQWRVKGNKPQYSDSPLFIGKNNRPLNIHTMRRVFRWIRKVAAIKRDNISSYQPRMHDLRHTFAVNRLTSWYQENKNVQQLLPILSVYLGHTCIAYTSVYLTMIDELLQEASIRFENYVTGEQQ